MSSYSMQKRVFKVKFIFFSPKANYDTNLLKILKMKRLDFTVINLYLSIIKGLNEGRDYM